MFFNIEEMKQVILDFSQGTLSIVMLLPLNMISAQNNSIQHLNLKLSNSQFNKLKLETKNGTRVTLNPSPNAIRDSNGKTLTNKTVKR